MSFRNLIIITTVVITTLSTLMTKTKSTNLKLHERKYIGQTEGSILKYHGFQTRHRNHMLHKKHKCTLDRLYDRPNEHLTKLSRYPTLDKIANRLGNQIHIGLNGIKVTTSNPYDYWDFTVPDRIADSQSKYTHISIRWRNRTNTMKDFNKMYGRHRYMKDDWMRESMSIKFDEKSDNNISFDGNKRLAQQITTAGPWDNVQRDVFPNGATTTKDPRYLLPTSSSAARGNGDKNLEKVSEKVFAGSFNKSIIPRLTENEGKKKKTTPMPYVAAHEHYEQVHRFGGCHVPKEKVIRVHEVHPDPSKSYSPSCTILHQCGDDTGCCKDLKQICKPKNTTKVELYFFTTTLGKPQTVEKLYFDNHTECECQRRTDESMPRDSEFRRNRLKKIFNTSAYEDKRKKNNCTCPSKFSTRYFQNGTCICDCFDKQDDCLILKRGKANFSYDDKLCIQQGVCFVPSCEFGSYIKRFGRCPNKKENHHFKLTTALPFRDLYT